MNQNPIYDSLLQWLSNNTQKYSKTSLGTLPIAIGSDIGLIREENQDQVLVLKAQVSKTKYFVVGVLCDGMGGMKSGKECASMAAISFLASCIENRKLNLHERLSLAVHAANDNVFGKFNGEGGATLSAFIFDNEENFEAVNVGDSRIYIFKDNELKQISKDDTIIGQLEREITHTSLNTQLLQYIGMGKNLEPHILEIPDVDQNSKLLLTSDGAHFIEHKTLQSVLRNNNDPITLVQRIIDISKWCGGHDNTSVLILNKIQSLFTKIEPTHSGTIELWSNESSVQLIAIPEKEPKRKAFVASDEVIDNDDAQEKTVSEDYLSSKKKSQKKKRTFAPKNKSLDEKKPQIRIDFDD